MRRWLIGAALILCSTAPVLAQLTDPPHDTPVACLDIIGADVRLDRTTLTATIQVAEGFCPYAHYFFHIDTDMDSESNIALQTKFDRDGNPSTTGLPGLTAESDHANHKIVWRAPLSEIAPANPTKTIGVWFRALLNTAKDRLPDSSTDSLPFEIGGAAAALIGPDGGMVMVSDVGSYLYGASLSIPQGALGGTSTISFGEVAQPPAFERGRRGYSAVNIKPSGLELLKPATLTLPFRVAELDPSASLGEETLSIFHYNVLTESWEGIETEEVDAIGARVISHAISSFSYFTLKDDEIFQILCAPDLSNPQPERRYLPLVLLHGFRFEVVPRGCGWGTGDTFGELGHMLCDEHVDVYEVLYNTSRSIQDSARVLRKAVTTVLSKTGAGAVNLVAHSMGGLVSRYAVEKLGEDRVYKILTAATPHLGALPPSLNHCYDPWKPPCKSYAQMAACSFLLEDPYDGLNPGIRSPHQPADLVACEEDYKLYAAYLDPVVPPASARGDDWSGTCVCGSSAAIFSDAFKRTLSSGCGPQGMGFCSHSGLDGIVNVRDVQHAMWEPIRSLATGRDWFAPGQAPPCGSTGCQIALFTEDFEAGLEKWVSTSTLLITGAEAYEGSHSLTFSDQNTGSGAARTYKFSVVPGHTYVLSVAYKTLGGGGYIGIDKFNVGGGVSEQWLIGDGSDASNLNTWDCSISGCPPNSLNQWKIYRQPYTVPGDVNFVDIKIEDFFGGLPNGPSVFFDKIQWCEVN